MEDWVFVRVYGPNARSEVDAFLQELDDIKARWDLLWCIGRDFNLIRFSSERCEGDWSDPRMRKFSDFIDR